MKYIGILSIVLLCLAVMTGSASAIGQPQGAHYGYQNYGMIGSPSPYGCGAVDMSRYPGSTEYCRKWIPGHWVQVRVMAPGYWIYRPVWIPARPMTQYKWVAGFWQTTGYHTRPDVYVWGTPQMGWYGMPYQAYQASGGGYFTPAGVWVPNNIQR